MSHYRRSPDFILFLATVVLLTIGVIMVFSASQVVAGQDMNDSYYFLKRQLLWALLGIGLMIFSIRIDYYNYKKYIMPALVVSFVLLIVVLIPGVGRVVNGARRWIGVGSYGFQPSEIVKITLILFTAQGLANKRERVRKFSTGMLPFLVAMALACALILMQPDLGTALSIAGTIFVMLFAAGAKEKHLGALAGVGLGAVALAIALAPYRMKRFTAFLDPWKDPSNSGFHIIQSLYALGSGGLFGVGLGRSHQKFFYLPERHTDFIFAIIGEELGFIGGAIILLLFFILIWRGFKIALASPDSFASLTAVGLTSLIALQAIINVGVVTSSLPITGIPLPLISFGGSSLLFTLLSVGILLNISRHVTQIK